MSNSIATKDGLRPGARVFYYPSAESGDPEVERVEAVLIGVRDLDTVEIRYELDRTPFAPLVVTVTSVARARPDISKIGRWEPIESPGPGTFTMDAPGTDGTL